MSGTSPRRKNTTLIVRYVAKASQTSGDLKLVYR
jgi:hypothetical protein